jgi:glycosyltransferase involved in cell wall biosynthesis
MIKPTLSIVIANYNYGRFLDAAIQSVENQGVGDNVELIICDAASTDNSVEIIKKYANGLPPNTERSEWEDSQCQNPEHQAPNFKLISWWCSEKDGGQSAAFNKGFSHARGEWLTWLNADDLLLPGTLSALFKLIDKKPHAEWITGNKVHFDSESGRIISVHWGPHWQPPFLRGRRAFSAVFGPSTFFKKSLYNRSGQIDESLHYAMDSAYWAKLTVLGVRQTRLWHLCWAFREHGESKTAGVQSDSVSRIRKAETERWRSQIGYRFPVSVTNIWWLVWAFWRIIDASWIFRAIQKIRFHGKTINQIMEMH